MQNIFFFSLFASMFSLVAALISQYGFGLVPCELCIAQRIPYGIVIVVALGGMMSIKYQAAHYTKSRVLTYLIILAFLTGSGIATYHSLVEKHLVKGPDACTSSGSNENLSIEDMLKKIQSAPLVACDQPQWQWHGITMAMLNAVWSFMLACVTFAWLRRVKNAQATR